MHHGVLGQKWGVRRYQNPDGSLTPKGKKRYVRAQKKELNRLEKKYVVDYVKSAKLTSEWAKQYRKSHVSNKSLREQVDRYSKQSKSYRKQARKIVNEILDKCFDVAIDDKFIRYGGRSNLANSYKIFKSSSEKGKRFVYSIMGRDT